MNTIDAILKTLILLIHEKQLYGKIKSGGLAKQVYETIYQNREKLYNGESEIISKLMDILNSIIEVGIDDLNSTLSSIATALVDKPVLSELLLKESNIEPDESLLDLRKKEIVNYVNFVKLKDILKYFNKRIYRKNANTSRIANEIKKELETIIDFKEIKDDSIINEVDFGNDSEIENAVEDTVETLSSGSILKTGWSCLNNMLQGGFRRGEFVTISALPYNYKSGLTKSLFIQLARLNEPILDNPKKKPLMLFLSFEEDMRVVLMFYYAYFKYLMEGKVIDTTKPINKEEMISYLKKYMREESKYNIKIIRMDPNKTNYEKVYQVVEDLEKNGYEIHAVFADYLSQISTEGCDRSGPMGNEYKDLFKKIRTFMTKKKILFVTPHQLNPDAKRLIRNGVPNQEFVKYLPNKGYYDHSSKLDQEIDLELFCHIAYINRKPYLTIQRGKHRIPTTISNEEKFIMLKYPKKAPIPEDKVDEKGNVIETHCVNENTENEDFGF